MTNKLETLSLFMDEKVQTVSPQLQKLFAFQKNVDNELIASIEKIQYERKYKLIGQLKEIITEISLYLHAPYMIGKKIVGIYGLNNSKINQTLKDIYGDAYKSSNLPTAYCKCVPTILYHGRESEQVSALNMSDISISVNQNDYLNAIEIESKDQLELGGLLRFISMPNPIIDANTVYIIIPTSLNERNKYYKAIYRSVDSLIAHDNFTTDKLYQFPNLKEITIAEHKAEKVIVDYANTAGIQLNLMSSLRDQRVGKPMRNFEYKYAIENIIYEIGAYLAERKKTLSDAIGMVNKDLVFKDSSIEEMLKKMQKEDNEALSNIDKLYNEFKSISDRLIAMISEIQQESIGSSLNGVSATHTDLRSVLMDLIIKMSTTFAQFPDHRAGEIMKSHREAYRMFGGDIDVASAICSDTLKEYVSEDRFQKFRNFKTKSEFVVKKKLDMAEKLNLTQSECKELVYCITDSRRPSDKRRLGEAYYNDNKEQTAKLVLWEALKLGDEEAGNLLMEFYDLFRADIKTIADYGNAKACYLVAKSDEDNNYLNTFRYLVIAAAKGYRKAVKKLGDYYYMRALSTGDAKYYDIAMSMYETAYKDGSEDTKMLEKMASITYDKKDYKQTMEYCEKSKTAYSKYLLGQIYENGYGCSADKKKAYKYYEDAASQGETKAQVCCEKLNAEFEAEAKKNTVQENTSYYSSSYYSGYYTSYYSSSSYSSW